MSVAPCTLSWPRMMLAPVPGLPTLPVANNNMQLARTFAVPTVCCVWPMDQSRVAGFSVANILATRSSCAPGTPLTRSTSSGFHLSISLRASSKPWTRCLMNSLSSQPFLKMCHIIPISTGMSVPGRMRTYSFACAAVRVMPRIDDDEVRLVELLAFEHVLQRNRVRFRRIAAHEDHGLGVADVIEAVGHRAVAPGIGYAGDGGRMADARLMVVVVGAPERRNLAEEISAFVGEFRRAHPIDRFRPGLLTDLHHLVADLIDGLIPFDARSTDH